MGTDTIAAWLRDVFREVPRLTIRRMFGGYGIYREGRMFALEADGMVYLKTDDTLRLEFEERGLPPFAYESKNGRRTVMSYHEAPPEALEQPAQMAMWAKQAWLAAERAEKKKTQKRKR